jgi:DNA-directed RNA polymerase sigma subunit (sigma70/sigma32)
MIQARTIRLPVHTVKRLSGLLRAQRDYVRETGHEAGSREVAKSQSRQVVHDWINSG